MRKSLNKQPGKFFAATKKAFAAGSLITALIAGSPTNAQTTAQNNKVTSSVNITSTDALTFALNNVDKYYPDMKQHLDSLVDHFRDQEQKDTVNFLFQEHVLKNITDPKDQVTAIIYCIEKFVFKGDKNLKKDFLNKYDIGTVIDENEYVFLINFNKGYNKRFKGYFKKLEQTLIKMNKIIEDNTKKIEDNKQEIEQMKKETEGIINTFTISDVKKDPTIKKLVLDTEQLYIKYKYKRFSKLIELAKAAKE